MIVRATSVLNYVRLLLTMEKKRIYLAYGFMAPMIATLIRA